MPYDEPDPNDPNVLVGVTMPGDRSSVREMAFTFAEEFAALGFDENRLLTLFQRPNYAGAHRAYEVLGEDEIRSIIRESLEVWGAFRIVTRDSVSDLESNEESGQVDSRVGPTGGGLGEQS